MERKNNIFLQGKDIAVLYNCTSNDSFLHRSSIRLTQTKIIHYTQPDISRLKNNTKTEVVMIQVSAHFI